MIPELNTAMPQFRNSPTVENTILPVFVAEAMQFMSISFPPDSKIA